MIEIARGAVLLVLVVMFLDRSALVRICVRCDRQPPCTRAIILREDDVGLILTDEAAEILLDSLVSTLWSSCLEPLALCQLQWFPFR